MVVFFQSFLSDEKCFYFCLLIFTGQVYRLWQALTGTVFAPAAKLGTRRLIFLKFVPLEPR